jgi:hypothetical protein
MELTHREEDIRKHKFSQSEVEKKVHPMQGAAKNSPKKLRDIRRMGRH